MLARRVCSSIATHGLIAVALLAMIPAREARAADRTFPSGSLIVPMDLTYQSRGLFQSYGLIYQLLRQNVHVYWLIDPNKTYHPAPCNTVGDQCAWDCAVEGSGVKCAYPTSSPDLTATTSVVWDDAGLAARDSALDDGPLLLLHQCDHLALCPDRPLHSPVRPLQKPHDRGLLSDRRNRYSEPAELIRVEPEKARLSCS